jgi:hypothetical protein
VKCRKQMLSFRVFHKFFRVSDKQSRHTEPKRTHANPSRQYPPFPSTRSLRTKLIAVLAIRLVAIQAPWFFRSAGRAHPDIFFLIRLVRDAPLFVFRRRPLSRQGKCMPQDELRPPRARTDLALSPLFPCLLPLVPLGDRNEVGLFLLLFLHDGRRALCVVRRRVVRHRRFACRIRPLLLRG